MKKRFFNTIAALAGTLAFSACGGSSGTTPALMPNASMPGPVRSAAKPHAGGTPKFFVWSALPKATAGTALAATTIKLTVQDASHATISGTFSTPVTVTDGDTSSITQGSSLSVNSGTASRSVKLTKSSDVLKLKYGGLAMLPVSLKAVATGATTASTNFTPTLKPIVCSSVCPTGQLATQEIDLYATPAPSGTPAPGSQGSFTVTQPGWKGGSFNNNFTYATSAPPSGTNNCTSYGITPASGTANVYTVTSVASPVAGACTMTVSGGAGQKTTFLLTFTVSGIGFNGQHQ